MQVHEVVQANRSAIVAIASRQGARNVRLFGSIARGEDIDISDINLLVVLEPGRSLLDHAALKLELEEFLGRPVDVATEQGLKPEYRE